MNLKRKIEVVMLSTNEAIIGSIILNINAGDQKNSMFLCETDAHVSDVNYIHKRNWKPQHLYFVSNEEIKENDWCILNLGENTRLVRVKSLNSGHPVFTVDIEDGYAQLSSLKKIIATTNKPLNLPEPSPQFIKKYIEEYNKGNKIQWVMVEYIKTTRCVKCKSLMEHWRCVCGEEYNYTVQDELKVDKNNQITIIKVKDNIQIGDELYSIMQQYLDYCHFYNYITPQKFIEENL